MRPPRHPRPGTPRRAGAPARSPPPSTVGLPPRAPASAGGRWGQASGRHEFAGLAAGLWLTQRGTAVNWRRPCRPDGEHSRNVPPVGRSSARTARASTVTQPEEYTRSAPSSTWKVPCAATSSAGPELQLSAATSTWAGKQQMGTQQKAGREIWRRRELWVGRSRPCQLKHST